MIYLKLKDVLTQAEASTAALRLSSALHEAAQHRFVTLDLVDTEEIMLHTGVEPLVEVIRDVWPHPACCLIGCMHPRAWQGAAVALGQPLLHWPTRVSPRGWQLFGVQLYGMSRDLFGALCRHASPVGVSAEQLAHNPSIVSQHRHRVDAQTIIRWRQTGRFPSPPVGPTKRDCDEVAHRLRQMAEHRYIVEVKPGRYSAVHPYRPG